MVSASTAGLPEWLAGRVDEHLAVFAGHMTQGLLAASTAVGLEGMSELRDVAVSELAGPKGKHDRSEWRCATAASRARSPWAGGGSGFAGPGPRHRRRRPRGAA
jgi:hypothetical protein